MDIEYDEEMTYGSDNEDQNETNEPWQCGLNNLQERAMALFRNGNYTDITLTFPGTDITYDVHCLILAISSPVFEGILYGPMKTEEETIELHGDDPLVMEYVLAYCYGYDLDLPDMDTALEVYKLADKYILDDLKHVCCKQIVSHMSKDNVKGVMEFSAKYNFSDYLKYNCAPYFREMFEEMDKKYDEATCYEDEPDYTVCSTILMDLNDEWIEIVFPKVCVRILDFHESWKYPKCPIDYNRLSLILYHNNWGNIYKFYGCINAENIQQFHDMDSSLELYLSVTDPHHAKRVIEAINQQKRFEKHLIAIHIRGEEVWPRNWLPLRTERTYRPSMLLISEADDGKVAWIIEAAKALLPQSEGTYTKEFSRGKYNEDGDRTYDTVKPVSILKFPRCRFTLMGLIALIQGLTTSGVIYDKLIIQSHLITSAEQNLFQQYRQVVHFLPMGHNIFRKVFEEYPIVEYDSDENENMFLANF